MPNTRNRANLRGQIDLLADGHLTIVEAAAKINDRLVKADEKSENGLSTSISIQWVSRLIGSLDADLLEQGLRIERVRAELETIRNNLRLN